MLFSRALWRVESGGRACFVGLSAFGFWRILEDFGLFRAHATLKENPSMAGNLGPDLFYFSDQPKRTVWYVELNTSKYTSNSLSNPSNFSDLSTRTSKIEMLTTMTAQTTVNIQPSGEGSTRTN
jgi:hypothetical protein